MFEQVAGMIAEQLGIDAAGIKPESRLVEDLKADSLDVVAMVMEMESQYGIQIPDEDLTKLKTVADVMQYIQDNQK
ncbi:MAG: acyl carrier protein [Candidatus Spyradocola sp.]|nr:acyl carrier protein [Candidatus Spyradocola sp.]